MILPVVTPSSSRARLSVQTRERAQVVGTHGRSRDRTSTDSSTAARTRQFLGTDEIFVVKHDGCGMLIATNDEFLQGLQANAQDPKADFSEDGLRAVEAMEFYSIKDKGVEQALEDDVIFLANHPAIKGSTAVHGMVYNPSTGRMRQLFANSQPVPPEYGQEESSYEDFMEGEFRVELAYPESGDDPEYAGQLAERCGFGVQDMDGKGPFTDADLEYHGNLLPQGADLGKGGLKSPSSPVNTTKVAGTRSKKAADEPAKSNKRKAKEAVKEDPKTEESAAEEPVPKKKATKGRPRKAAKVAEPKPTKKKSGKKA